MPATLISATPKSLYQYVGKNMAPRRDLEELADRGRCDDPSELQDALQKKYHGYKKRQYPAWTEIVDSGRMVSNLTEGKMILMRHALDNRYLFVPKNSKFADNKTVGGLFQFYRTKLDAEWLSSRPEREPICPSDDDQIEEFMAAVKIVQDYYNTRFFDDRYERLEMDSLACFGTSISRFRFDPNPDVEDIVCEILPFPACRWDIRFRAEESPYFLYDSKSSVAVLRHLLDIDVNEDDDTGDENFGLRVIERLATQGGNTSGHGKENPYGVHETVPGEKVVTEMWLQPEEYCDIDLKLAVETLSGVTIPKGKSLLDVFPKGMCVVGIDSMNTIIGLYAENHKDHIVTGLYHAQSFCGVGKGVSDAVDVMKELNDLHSQLLAHVKAHSTPGYGYNQAIVTEEQARNIGKPRKNIPFDFTNAPDGVNSINQAVQSLVPGNPASSAFAYKQELEDDLQMAFQVTNFSDGMPGVDNKTATGAKIGYDNSQQLLVPQHRDKADTRKRQDKIIYNLFKKFVNKPKFFASRDLNGVTKGIMLSGDKFNDVDIDFQVVADSEIPRTQFTKQLALATLMQQAGGLGNLIQAAQMNPEIVSAIATVFGADIPLPKTSDIARVCRKRIEQAKKLLQAELQMQQIMTAVMGEPPDNTNLAASIVDQLQPPISPKEPYFQQKVAWLAELLDLDEMQYAPIELRYVIEEMIDRHLQAAVLGQAQVEYDQNLATIMANLPALVGEQAMNQQNQTIQQQYQQQQKKQATFILKDIEPITRNQELVFRDFSNGKNLLIHGLPGTGKSYISLFLALSEIENFKSYRNITIIRSVVPSRDMGFLPGSIKEKSKIYELPYQAICAELYGRGDAYEVLKNKGLIDFQTSSFLRGLTIDNSIVIVDECQNMTFQELSTIITRTGNNSRIIFCGDYRQTDLKYSDEKSGIFSFMEILHSMTKYFRYIRDINFYMDNIQKK